MKTRLSNDFVGMLHEHARRRANPSSGGTAAVFDRAAEVIERRGKEWAESVLWQELTDSGKSGSRANAELLVLADEAETVGRHQNSATRQKRDTKGVIRRLIKYRGEKLASACIFLIGDMSPFRSGWREIL